MKDLFDERSTAKELVKLAEFGTDFVCSAVERAALTVDVELLGGRTLRAMVKASAVEVPWYRWPL